MRRTARLPIWVLGVLLLALPAACAQETAEKRYSGKTIAAWIKDLQSDDVGTRRTAAMVLSKVGAPAFRAAKALAGVLEKDRDENVRYYAVQALGRMGSMGREAVPALIKVMC